MARLLIVDDVEPLLALLKRSLERQGHTVETAATAEEALCMFAAAKGAIELAVVDLTLPDRPGEDVAVEMAAAQASLQIILFSGHPFELESLPAHVKHRAEFLPKPFPARALGEMIARMLS